MDPTDRRVAKQLAPGFEPCGSRGENLEIGVDLDDWLREFHLESWILQRDIIPKWRKTDSGEYPNIGIYPDFVHDFVFKEFHIP